MDGVIEEPTVNLDHLEIPEGVSDHSFSFFEEESGGKHVDSASLSPQTLVFKKQITDIINAEGVEEFGDKPNLGYPSVYTNRPINTAWVSLSDRYHCVISLHSNKIWGMPKFEMHRILLIYFEYGLRLSMHPFHLTVYKEVGCGVAQLTPNSVA